MRMFSCGHRRKLTPERVEGVAVESPGARLEPAGIGEMRRADLRDVHQQFGVLAHEHACGPGVVEVDVREQEVAHVAELDAAFDERSFEPREAGRRPAVEEGRPVVRLEEIRGDDAVCALVHEVERIRAHVSPDPPMKISRRPSGGGRAARKPLRPRRRPRPSRVPRRACRRAASLCARRACGQARLDEHLLQLDTAAEPAAGSLLGLPELLVRRHVAHRPVRRVRVQVLVQRRITARSARHGVGHDVTRAELGRRPTPRGRARCLLERLREESALFDQDAEW